jgi:hypothetical protein
VSLYINTNKVTAVLLADGWHDVVPNTFDLDSYEMHDGAEYLLLGGGQADGVCQIGFGFIEEEEPDTTVYGPLTSILAVKEDRSHD